MRSVLLALLLLGTLVSNAQRVNLAQGLVAYYPFNGNANDVSGNGNNPTTNTATLTTDRFGTANSAYSFDGSTSYMEIPDASSLHLGTTLSVCAWVKVNGFSSAQCHGNKMIYKGNTDAQAGSYGIEFGDVVNNPSHCTAGNPVNSTQETFYGSGTDWTTTAYIQDSTWYFVVVTYDGTTARQYINGALIESNTISVTNFTNTADLFFGKLNSPSTYFLNGVMDDIRIYSRAINQCEVSKLYDSTSIDLNQGLVAYYPFNGNANDVSGNGNNPTTNTATLTTDRFGTANSAYSFDGSTSYMEIPDASSLHIGTTLSVCAWVKVNGFSSAQCHGNKMIYKGNTDAQAGSYGIEFGDVVNNPSHCTAGNPVNSTQETFYGSGTDWTTTAYIQTGTWYFVVVTYDGTTARQYINGALIESNTISVTNFTNTADLYFGKLNNSGSSTYFLNGVMDDIRIYNRAIDSCEVNALYSCSSALDQGLVAYYPFNGNANDLSGNANNPTTNTATLTTDRFGNANSAYSFNGSTSYMEIPDASSLHIGTTLSVCAWVKVNGFSSAQCHGNKMIYKGNTDAQAGSYGIEFGDVVNNPSHCTAGNPVNSTQETFYGSGTGWNTTAYIQDSTWYFVVVTYDGTTARQYINGALIESNTISVTNFTNTADLYFGKLNNSGSSTYFLNGIMDDIRIYNRAITPCEVSALYTPADSVFNNAHADPLVLVTPSDIQVIGTYPNPFKDHVSLSLSLQKAGTAGITITDMNGKVVRTQTTVVSKGNNTINVDNLGNLAQGVYIVQAVTTDGVITKKIVKANK